MFKNKLLLLKIHIYMFKKNDRKGTVVDVGLVLGLIFILICSSSPPIFYGLFYSPSSSSIFFPHSLTSYASPTQETTTNSGDDQIVGGAPSNQQGQTETAETDTPAPGEQPTEPTPPTTPPTQDVTVQNQPPIANAGPDQTAVQPGQRVTLDGTGSSDPDGGRIDSYSWSLVSSPPPAAGGSAQIDVRPNDNRGASQARFTAPQIPGDYVFQLVVTDNEEATSAAPDTVLIRVGAPPSGGGAGAPPANQAPIADAGPDQTVKPGDTVTLDGTRSRDPDVGGTIVRYAWNLVVFPAGSTGIDLQPNYLAPNPTFTAPQVAGDYTFQLSVTDNKGASSPIDYVVIRVVPASGGGGAAPPANQAPIADAGPDQTVNPGTRVALDGTRSRDPDPGGTITNYYWYLAECPDRCVNPIRVQPNNEVANPTFT